MTIAKKIDWFGQAKEPPKRKKTNADWKQIYEIAAKADVSHHSVLRALQGREVRGRSGRRLAEVLAEYGLRVGSLAPKNEAE